jgi:hypothetical protein
MLLDGICKMYLWENKVLKGLKIRTDYEFIMDDLSIRDVGYSF